MLVLALISGLALARPATNEGELDRLIERTNALEAFSARYSVATTTTDASAKKDVPQSLRIDYAAPGRVRVDTQLSSGLISYGCIDGVYTIVASGDDGVYGRVDFAAIRERASNLESEVARHVKLLPRQTTTPGAAVGMRWRFDDKTQKANYQVDAIWADERRTVLGWLETLRSKDVELHTEGEQLTFVTDDGAFHGALSTKTGFLEDLWGKSPTGEVHFHLEQLELAVDNARFTLPGAKPSARDVSADLERNFTGLANQELRTRTYRSIAAEPGDPWSVEKRDNIERALRAFHKVVLADALAPWREMVSQRRDTVADRLRELAKTKTAEEVGAARAQELERLGKALDELGETCGKRLLLPETKTPLARGDELLDLERKVVARVFDENFRKPVIADFERATEPATK